MSIKRQPESSPSFCLLGADYENSNLGIRALATGALTVVYTAYPNASVYMLEYGREPHHYDFDILGKHVLVEMQNIRFSKKPWQQNHVACLITLALFRRLFGIRSMPKNPSLRELMNTDYVLSLNYGDSFSDIYGLQRFIYVCLPQILALLVRKPLVQLPQTIGPFKSWICRSVASWILSRSDKVYVRAEELVAEVRALVPSDRKDSVTFCNDLAFIVAPKAFYPPELNEAFGHRPVVGFNISGLLFIGGYTSSNQFGLRLEYKELVLRSIALFAEQGDANVILVPHLLVNHGEADNLACQEILQELQSKYAGRLFMVNPPYDEAQIKSVIARCDFFVGARMHACIAALSQCVPTVGMAYSGKFSGVFCSVGMGAAVADLRTLSIEDVLHLLLANYKQREVLRTELERRVPEVKSGVFEVMNSLKVAAIASEVDHGVVSRLHI
jgi:polysaccharide pyruvyl transferase WcaK-like protein